MADNTSVLIFKAITGFISDLNTEFGSKHKSIVLYNRLLEKTGLTNVGPINKHIESFRKFFEANQKAMEEQSIDQFTNSVISYSDKVYVDVKTVLTQSNSDNKKIIWQHLLTIWGLIDPTSQAKKILKESVKSAASSGDKEDQFLANIISKVEQSVGGVEIDQSNPMGSISTLMQSGVFSTLITDMQQGLSDGSLDISKLLGSVQGMMVKMNGANGGDASNMPDLSSMMSMMGPMMGNFMQNMGGAANNANKEEKKD
jgi:hypothetical protein